VGVVEIERGKGELLRDLPGRCVDGGGRPGLGLVGGLLVLRVDPDLADTLGGRCGGLRKRDGLVEVVPEEGVEIRDDDRFASLS
jgi:hypothetical protein